jgi:transcriptional regulator with XRE-family HTH domain
MDFGQWLRKLREDRGIDLRSLAGSAKLSPSTLSRVERSIIDPTLMTAVRITQALQAKPEEFYSYLSGKSFEYPISLDDADSQVVTLEDVIGFERLVPKNPEFVERILADKLNQIQNELPEEIHFPNAPPYKFSSGDVLRLLNGSPLYEISLQYPNAVKVSSIFDIYRKGGLIIRKDVASYITQKYIEKQPKIRLGSEEAKITTIQNSSLIEESGRKVKLSEIIRVDSVLADKGEILSMSFKALELERVAKLNPPPSITLPEPLISWWNLQCLKYGYMLIILSRWIEALDLPDSEWLDEIRGQMNFEV